MGTDAPLVHQPIGSGQAAGAHHLAAVPEALALTCGNAHAAHGLSGALALQLAAGQTVVQGDINYKRKMQGSWLSYLTPQL